MAKTLSEMRDDLYAAFDETIKRGHQNFKFENNASHQAAAQSFSAAAQIAKSITDIEKELRDARAQEDGANPIKKFR